MDFFLISPLISTESCDGSFLEITDGAAGVGVTHHMVVVKLAVHQALADMVIGMISDPFTS